MADDSPSWLTSDTTGADAAPAAVEESVPAAASAPAPAASSATQSEVEDPDPELTKNVIFAKRIFNMLAVSACLIHSVLFLIGKVTTVAIKVLSGYSIILSFFVFLSEMPEIGFLRRTVAVRFGFLFSAVYRFLFYCLLATIQWAYDSLFGKINAVALIVVAIYNTYVLCRYPAVRKKVDKIRREEEARENIRIAAEQQKRMRSQLNS